MAMLVSGLLSLALPAYAVKQYSESSCILLQQQIDDYKRRLGRGSPLYIKAAQTHKQHCQQPVESRVSRAITRAKQMQVQAEYEAQQAAISKKLAAEKVQASTVTPVIPKAETIQPEITQPEITSPEVSGKADESGVEFYTATEQAGQISINASEALSSAEQDVLKNEQSITKGSSVDENSEDTEIVEANNSSLNSELVQQPKSAHLSKKPNVIDSLFASASWVWIAGLAGIILLLVLLKIRQKQSDSTVASVSSEEDTQHILEAQLDHEKYQFVHDVTLAIEGGGNTHIDHIVVSTFGVFVIDTKKMKGTVIGNEHQEQWTNTQDKEKHTFQNPLRENLNHTKLLATILNMPLDNLRAIVIFADTCSLPAKMPKNVGYAKEMISYIQSIERSAFNQETANEVMASINRVKLSTSEMVTETSTPEAGASSIQSETIVSSADETIATATQDTTVDDTKSILNTEESTPLEMAEPKVEKSAEETGSQEKVGQENKLEVEEPIAPVEEEMTSGECNEPEQNSASKESVSQEQTASLAETKKEQAEATDPTVSTTAKDGELQESNIDIVAPIKPKIKIGFAPPMEPRDKDRKPFTPPEAEGEPKQENIQQENKEEKGEP